MVISPDAELMHAAVDWLLVPRYFRSSGKKMSKSDKDVIKPLSQTLLPTNSATTNCHAVTFAANTVIAAAETSPVVTASMLNKPASKIDITIAQVENTATASSGNPSTFPLSAFSNTKERDEDIDVKSRAEVLGPSLSTAQKFFKTLEQKFSQYVKEDREENDCVKEKALLRPLMDRAAKQDKEAAFELGYFYYMKLQSLKRVLLKETAITIMDGYALPDNLILKLGRQYNLELHEAAMNWFNQVGNQNNAANQLNLATQFMLSKIELGQYNSAHPNAERLLDILYLPGKKIPPIKPRTDKEEQEDKKVLQRIFKRFNETANQGFDLSQFMMGQAYRCGVNKAGIEKDVKKACEFYLAAANKGHGAAQYNLAACYLLGEGLAQDLSQASTWMSRAIGTEKAGFIIDPLPVNVNAKKNFDDIMSAGHKADNESLGQAVEQMDKRSNALKNQNLLVKNLLKLTADDLFILEAYAAKNNGPAQYKLGMYLYLKLGPILGRDNKINLKNVDDTTAKSICKMLEYMRKAVENKLPEAMLWQADWKLCLAYGKEEYQQTWAGGSTNHTWMKEISEICKLYQEAADLGNDTAQFIMGYLYQTGSIFYQKGTEEGFELSIGHETNLKYAYGYYLAAAKQGDVPSQNNLAAMYALGLEVPQNKERAIYWLTKAVGQPAAIKRVEEIMQMIAKKQPQPQKSWCTIS